MRIVTFIVPALVLVLLFTPFLTAEESEDETVFETDLFRTSLMNGKPWARLNPQSRVMYLVGIQEGAALLIAEMDSVRSEKGNARAAYPAMERLTIKGFRFSEIVEEIDRLYQQASNRRIPVIEAYRFVLKKFKGASPGDLASSEAALRMKYNK
jgi:hypothetical protein